MYEHQKEPLVPLHVFITRLTRNLLIGLLLAAVSLVIGMIGYHHFEKMTWVDAYVNSAMILSGMGPVSSLQTTGGKLFAGTYALFCGIVFLAAIALVFAPILHRFFHKFHLEEPKNSKLKSK